MKKIALVLCLFVTVSITGFADNNVIQKSVGAAKLFNNQLKAVQAQLKAGKITNEQAQVYLSIIRIRQNNVLILQNAALMKLIVHGKGQPKQKQII